MSPYTTAEEHLDLLIDLQNHMGKVLAPYEEFILGAKTYYLSPGGFLYRKEEPATEEVGGDFCGYLDDEVWDQLKNHLGKDTFSEALAKESPGASNGRGGCR